MLSYDYATTRHNKVVGKIIELDWESTEIKKWKEDAVTEQQNFYEILGEQKTKPQIYSKDNKIDLERKIAYAMYGPPSQLPNVKKNAGTGYSKKQLKLVRKTCNVILKKSGRPETYIKFLFISTKLHNQQLCVPLFRLLTEKNKHDNDESELYVDGDHRVYHGFKDYIENNRLPRCFMCYPHDGVYTATDNKVDVEFGESPACSLPVKIFDALDISTSLVATALGITALVIPVSAPLAIAAAVGGLASGIFGLTRSAKSLVDRHKHGQTIGLNSEEARGNWLGVVGNTVGMALGGVNMAASKILQGGKLAGLGIGSASLSIGVSAVKGLSVVDHFASIGKKLAEEEEVTPLDAFQIVSSVFFFTDSVVSTQTAFSALQCLKSAGGNVKMLDVLQVVQSRSAVNADILQVSKTSTDGHDEDAFPEMSWPKRDDKLWSCNII